MKKLRGRIVDLYNGKGGFKYIEQGIKKDQQPFYDRNFWGSNGNYIIQDATFPAIYAKVSIYEFENSAIEVDIREAVMTHYGWERISDNRISQLKEKLVGEKVKVLNGNSEYSIENLVFLLK